MNAKAADLANTALQQEVIAAIQQKGELNQRELRVHAKQGTVIVEGVLPTYYLRQLTLECIKRVPGVISVVDLTRVIIDPQSSTSPGAGDNVEEAAD